LNDSVQEMLALGRHRFGDVEGLSVSFSQTFRCICSIRELPEEAQVALAIRLKGDPTAV
jgi:hypothetical protein